MKKKWIVCLVVIVCILSVLATSMYYRSVTIPTKGTYVGTYQINSSSLGSNEEVSSVDYLAIAYPQDENKGEFSLYNSQSGVKQDGICQMEGSYLSLVADDETYLLFYAHKQYYLVTKDMKPEIIEKVSDDAIE